MIEAKDKASVQINIGHVNGARFTPLAAACAPGKSRTALSACAASPSLLPARVHILRRLLTVLRTLLLPAADGVYTGEWTTMALCGFIRGMGEGDGCLDRLWTKCYDEAKASGVDL